MSSRAKFMGGDARKVAGKPNPSYPFEKGDLLFRHPADGTLRPATAMPAQGTEALDQLGFAEYFAGVADEKYGLMTVNGVTEKTFNLDGNLPLSVSVCTGGRWEFDCPLQTLPVGPVPVGIYSAGGVTGITSSQKVDVLASPAAESQAIGVLWPQEAVIEGGYQMNRMIVDINARLPGTAPGAGTYTGTSGQ
jgi:hypothetical protein